MHFRITWEFLKTIYIWALSLKDSDLLGLGDVLACLFGIVYLSDSDVKLVFQVFLAHCLPFNKSNFNYWSEKNQPQFLWPFPISRYTSDFLMNYPITEVNVYSLSL